MDATPSLLSQLEPKFLRLLLPFLQPADVARLAAASRPLRASVRALVLRGLQLEFAEARRRLSKDFFRILRGCYCKKLVRFSKEEFARLLAEPRAKELQPVVRPFFVGERVVASRVGPKLAGFLTDRGDLLLLAVKDLERLALAQAARVRGVRRFEVAGCCVVEKLAGGLACVALGEQPQQAQERPLPAFLDDAAAQLVAWSSSFDRLAAVYRHGATGDEHSIFLAGLGSLAQDEPPTKLAFRGEVGSLGLGKCKLLLAEKAGALHAWDLEAGLAHEAWPAANVKRVYSNALLSFLCTRHNRMKRLEDLSNEELVRWFQFLGLGRFEDTVRYSKLTGKAMGAFGRAEYEKLLGFPQDSPEVNHLYLHNRLLSTDYFKSPELLAHGYNGNNELGLSTGNQMIADFQDFALPLADHADDIVDVKVGGLTSFMTSRKGRRFCCLEPEDRQPHSHKLDKDKEERAARGAKPQPADSESSEDSGAEEPRGKKKKAGRKGSKTLKPKEEKRQPEKRAGPKKFEKLKWREISDLFAESPALRHLQVEQLDCSKTHVFAVCHEKPLAPGEENPKNQLLAIGAAVTKVLHDPKLKQHRFDVGLRHA
jgi:hypothetical protein